MITRLQSVRYTDISRNWAKRYMEGSVPEASLFHNENIWIIFDSVQIQSTLIATSCNILACQNICEQSAQMRANKNQVY